MNILLAPMDGISDFYIRDILTSVGGYDRCMTEFLRVTESIFPKRTFYQNCPEIMPQHQLGGKTRSGTPVSIQLLGNHSGYLAENAFKAESLGISGIDINFGCPSNSVNKHGSGAILLQQPEKVYRIMSTIRQALSADTQLSAKMRLGYQDSSRAVENALAIAQAGADFITIHARTKKDGYRPPAKWHLVAEIKAQINIPVVMNGELWSLEDYRCCREISGCSDIMLARGAFARPDLAAQIKADDQSQRFEVYQWQQVRHLLDHYYHLMLQQKPIAARVISGRLKLWLKWLMASYDEAVEVFERIKKQSDPDQIMTAVNHLGTNKPQY